MENSFPLNNNLINIFPKPPVTAFHSDSTCSNNWKYYGTVNPKIKFWGKSIEIQPKGTLTLELNKYNNNHFKLQR